MCLLVLPLNRVDGFRVMGGVIVPGIVPMVVCASLTLRFVPSKLVICEHLYGATRGIIARANGLTAVPGITAEAEGLWCVVRTDNKIAALD